MVVVNSIQLVLDRDRKTNSKTETKTKAKNKDKHRFKDEGKKQRHTLIQRQRRKEGKVFEGKVFERNEELLGLFPAGKGRDGEWTRRMDKKGEGPLATTRNKRMTTKTSENFDQI